MREKTGPLSLSTLEDAYQSISYGYNEPDVLKMNRTTAEKLKTILYLRTTEFRFNNAQIVICDSMEDDVALFENSDSPRFRKALIKQLKAEDYFTCRVKFSES